jgi:hypothetical protein
LFYRIHNEANMVAKKRPCVCISGIHGTRGIHPITLVKKKTHGPILDVRKCKSDGYWGQALYFSKSADYQHTYQFTHQTDNTHWIMLCDIMVGSLDRQVRTGFHHKSGVLDVTSDEHDSVGLVNDGWQSYPMWENSRVITKYVIQYEEVKS